MHGAYSSASIDISHNWSLREVRWKAGRRSNTGTRSTIWLTRVKTNNAEHLMKVLSPSSFPQHARRQRQNRCFTSSVQIACLSVFKVSSADGQHINFVTRLANTRPSSITRKIQLHIHYTFSERPMPKQTNAATIHVKGGR